VHVRRRGAGTALPANTVLPAVTVLPALASGLARAVFSLVAWGRGRDGSMQNWHRWPLVPKGILCGNSILPNQRPSLRIRHSAGNTTTGSQTTTLPIPWPDQLAVSHATEIQANSPVLWTSTMTASARA
jgi:hypothetical protein